MSLALVQDLCLSFGDKVVFNRASFSIGPRDRVGLVGANGTGKSSLLRLLVGLQLPDEGSVRFSRQARVGYLPQELGEVGDEGLVDTVLHAVPGRRELGAQLQSTEEALAQATAEVDQIELSQELADRHRELDHFDELYGRHRAEAILSGLGFRVQDLSRPVSSLSGGWRIRAALAGLLLQDPELLLLDEPTNHLDLPTLTWFEDFLHKSRKAMILVSHDREFLDRQIDRVIALEGEGLRTFRGTYTQFKAHRAQELEQLRAEVDKQQARRAEMKAFIARFGAKASKARQARSRARMLEREQPIEIRRERGPISFQFPPCAKSVRDVVVLKNISKSYGDVRVFESLDAKVERGEHIAIVGPNGAGKTTLLKLLAGAASPEVGEVVLGEKVQLGYYAQHQADELNPAATILEEVRQVAPDKTDRELRTILGAFLFSSEAVDRRVGVLSGGEKARVALAKLLCAPCNLLLMDEPTNHLDLDSSEALIQALEGFDGTLLFVSHNRSFLNRLGSVVWEIKNRGVLRHPGNLDDYLYHLQQEVLGIEPAGAPGEKKSVGSPSGNARERRRAEAEARNERSAKLRPIQREIEEMESLIAELEARQRENEAALADPGLYLDFDRAKQVMESHRLIRAKLDSLYQRWEERQKALALF